MPSKYGRRWRARVSIRVPGSPGVYREITRVCGTKREAVEWEVANGRGGQRTALTIAQLWEREQSEIEYGLAVGSLQPLRANVRVRILPELGDLALDQITAVMVEQAQARWQASRSFSVARNTRSTLSRIFRHAVKQGYVRTNPVTDALSPRGMPVHRTMNFSDQTFHQVLGRIEDPGFRFYTLMAARTGLRPAELAAVAPSAVDLDARRIHVVRAYQGSGGRGGLGPTKNRQRRIVPLSSDVVAGLEDLVSRSDGDFLFRDEHGQPVLHQGYHRRMRWSQISPDLRFYDLRAYAIVSWLKAAVPVHSVRDWAGHSTLAVTSTYARAAGVDDLAAAHQWDSYISRTRGSDGG